MKIKVRIAPSPTGPFHLGNARSALFNYVFARKHRGVFVLRMEDTDIARSEEVYENDIKEALSWLGLSWDEYYRESDRLEVYREYLNKLFDNGNIFWCRHTKDELRKEREADMQAKEASRHVCAFRDGGGMGERDGSILRFKNDSKTAVEFHDSIRGKISFHPELLGDFSIARSFDSPLYNFAATIDDALMEITHVIRGEDHISNTPKQILLLEALRFNKPRYAHLPLLLGKDHSKLSKRHGATSVSQYRKDGYLAGAMVNFLALLGWHPTKEQVTNSKKKSEDIFSMENLIANFELKDVQKGGAVFDIDKLNWMNGEYIRGKAADELDVDLGGFLKPEWRDAIKSDPGKWRKIVALEQPRLTRLIDIESRVDYFFEEPLILTEELGWKNQKEPEIRKNLEQLVETLSEIPENQFVKENIEKAANMLVGILGTGELLWPMRYALSGKRASPGPFEIADILGKKITIARLKKTAETLRL